MEDLVVDPKMEARFWAKVSKGAEDECWEWQAYRNMQRGGYGVLMDSRTRKPVLAHRVSYAIEHGATPSDLMVLHSCDNPPCVNPKHLSLGTNQDNMQDAWVKGRLPLPKNAPKGETHHSAVLTEELALRIKIGDLKGFSLGVLAKQFGLSKSAISRLRRGKSWKNLSLEPPEKSVIHGE